MKLYIDYIEFTKVTGRITDSIMLEALALHPSTRKGMFQPEQLPELLSFCEENPEYHIISVVNQLMFVNKMKDNGIVFYLGNGDKTENLYYSESLKCGFSAEI